MKNKIIIALTLISLILAFFLFQKPKVVVKTETIIDTIIKIKVDTIDNTKPTEIKKVVVKVPITKYDTIEKIVYKDIKTNRYTYKDTLDNGIVESIIFADNIYERNIKLKTFDKTVLIKTKEVLVRNDMYLGGTITLSENKSVLNSSINIFYTHKGRFLLGTGIGYDTTTKKPFLPITIAFNF